MLETFGAKQQIKGLTYLYLTINKKTIRGGRETFSYGYKFKIQW